MKISIITVNLNNRFGLENTIRSVTDQTMQPFEWIVVDGASTDGSKELTQANTRMFLKWISEKDKILDGSKVGDGSVIAAGSIVRGFYPDNSVIAGVPAKVIKMR